MVAPFVGAWVETVIVSHAEDARTSRPSWARGLKLDDPPLTRRQEKSRPSWARGLKQNKEKTTDDTYTSRPSWARGLKHQRKERFFWSSVAPFVGAWVETYLCSVIKKEIVSRALRGRVG